MWDYHILQPFLVSLLLGLSACPGHVEAGGIFKGTAAVEVMLAFALSE